jgi:hypothetical protein
MNRVLLYSVILLALFGVDATVNDGSLRRDLTSAVVGAGRTTHSMMVATASFMTGRR